jgi:hypothetical protein
MDLSSVNKHSPARLLSMAVFWSCIGGVWLGEGIQQFLRERFSYSWASYVLLGSVSVAFGIFWAVMLMRRIGHASKERP